mgnify:FL=1
MTLNGKELLEITKETFNTDKVTREQINEVLNRVNPSSYLLEHHTVKGHPITFNIPNHDMSNAQGHRP